MRSPPKYPRFDRDDKQYSLQGDFHPRVVAYGAAAESNWPGLSEFSVESFWGLLNPHTGVYQAGILHTTFQRQANCAQRNQQEGTWLGKEKGVREAL
jgi:hypothetical protein